MTDVALLIVLSMLLVVLIVLRFEIAFVLGGIGLLWLLFSGESLTIFASRALSGINSFVLLAVPFFLFAGELMNKSGITTRLIRIANLVVGRFRGGLAQANIASSVVFAGISGAAIADVAALGSVFIPSMEEEGYDRAFTAAVTAASSIVGPILPPSIILVIYGGVTDTSVAALFAAAVIPGLVLATSMVIILAFLARRRDLPRYTESIALTDTPKLAVNSITALTFPAIILFGIVFGIFTATEAAAVACAYAIVMGIAYLAMSANKLYTSLHSAMERTAQLYAIIAFAAVLSWMLAREGIPRMIAQGIADLGFGALGFFLIICVLLLFIGTWLEITAATIIFAPTLADAAVVLGIEPLHFGIVMVMTLAVGLITPPLGICLFVAASISKREVWDITKQVLPFYLADLAAILVLILFPQLTMYLPQRFGLA